MLRAFAGNDFELQHTRVRSRRNRGDLPADRKNDQDIFRGALDAGMYPDSCRRVLSPAGGPEKYVVVRASNVQHLWKTVTFCSAVGWVGV